MIDVTYDRSVIGCGGAGSRSNRSSTAMPAGGRPRRRLIVLEPRDGTA
jgi:hypothetical protein